MKWGFGKAAAIGFVFVALAAGQGRQAARPKVVPPKGPVRQVLLTSCSSCHGIDDYAYSALDRAGWQGLLETKHKGLKVVISEENRSMLLDYLVSEFGPNSKPFPRTYVPREVTEFFSDPEARRLLDRTCTSCHALDRLNERHKEDQWRAILVSMREKGASLSDDDLERMVEWLVRVRGTN